MHHGIIRCQQVSGCAYGYEPCDEFPQLPQQVENPVELLTDFGFVGIPNQLAT